MVRVPTLGVLGVLRVLRVLCVLCVLSLAGCMAPADDGDSTHAADDDRPLPWARDAQCPCTFYVALPEDIGPEAWLEVRVFWDGAALPDAALSVQGPGEDQAWHGVRGFDARRVQVWDAPSGTYRIEVDASGPVRIDARTLTRQPLAEAEMLPNLTTTVPVDVHVGFCDPVERLEQGATRCLRLGNGVSNPGHGPLQVYLSVPEGAQALAASGSFEQHILQGDGTMRARPANEATFHPTHAHWHYDGLARFSLHAVDEATGLRTGEVGAHHKAGFCFLDWDEMPENETEPGAGGYAETSCLVPTTDGWSNGISAGWYDFYTSGLTDQYVDIAGVPDGVYELVSMADPGGTLAETDAQDNAASVVIRLAGDDVEVLEERGWYRVQPDDEPGIR